MLAKCRDVIIGKDNTGNTVYWSDSMHFSCKLYEGARWCTDNKETGPGWNGFWGEMDGFTAHGMSAKEACCGCGGGNKNPDDSEPLYDGVPSYPYAEICKLIVHMILHTTKKDDTVI